MPFWHIKGGQNPSGIRSKVAPEAFVARTLRFVEDYQIGEENGIPIVAPPPGADVYLLGQMWRWYPALRLEEGASYTLHLSSLDVNHGFGLYPANINFQVVPGYDYGLTITAQQAGRIPHRLQRVLRHRAPRHARPIVVDAAPKRRRACARTPKEARR
jgi:cytochrome c oxidase subunit II